MNTLRINAEITSKKLDDIRIQLKALLVERSVRFRHRYNSSATYTLATRAVKPTAFVGILLAIWLFYLIGLKPFSVAAFLFFAGILCLFWNRAQVEHRRQRLAMWIFEWLADWQSRQMVRAAAKIAPFVAEYEMRGDLISYFRIKDERADLVWSRRLQGFRYAGSGFSMFFKSDRSLNPTMLMLHEDDAELDSQFANIGIQALSTAFEGNTL